MKAAIVGATGYGGIELIRILHNHPKIEDITVFSSSQEGKTMAESYPHVSEIVKLTLGDIQPERLNEHDVVFLSTPPGVSADLSEKLSAETKIIDLSGDLRLKQAETYSAWYQRESASESLLQKAVYGLTEWHKEEIESAVILSNPGCYATASLLGAAPIAQYNAVDTSQLIIDAKSGTTGAGRSPSAMTHFSEMNDNFKVYKVNQHKHTPEIEQELENWTNKQSPVTFTPHLVPMTRGIMATMYAPLQAGWSKDDIEELYHSLYDNHPFVRVRGVDTFPATKEVYGTNYCDIGFTVDERTGRLTVVSVIDNLMKGASGQAVQNMNIMFGYPEKEGLDFIPIYP
ncbi:N-acetyl-gamma-glutamyl-phosphate reductase [Salibacterium salarium]|uniref:N-acetyl-gamma-glutamyl-phosphate reductase n=1 Tax=Salibacterium salarium TaxID=284579 RepID=A0A3R9WPV0_9BACI|nr:N-acetyl-gamma-glutamyl-phosphate reductase [Salibacterium salarium]RSL31014.1 N-acetyl-gamma-glutamyl-phosphate reductase [Salibacterium salarium]